MARARSSMTPPSSASHAKELLDAGTISQPEFDAIKAKTLSP